MRSALALVVAAIVLAIAPSPAAIRAAISRGARRRRGLAVAAREAMARKAWDVAAKHLSASALVRHPDDADLHSDLGFAFAT